MIKRIITFVLLGALVVGLIAGVSAISKIETKTVSPLNFSVGGLDDQNGRFVDDNTKICTKNAIMCEGLSVTPAFDCDVSYRIFWYNEDELYIGCTEILSAKFVDAIPSAAKYCRIEVIPTGLDSAGNEIEDFKVNFWEPVTYANDIKIKVNIKQDFKHSDLYDAIKKDSDKIADSTVNIVSIVDDYALYENYFLQTRSTFVDSFCKSTMAYSFVKLDCTDVKSYKISSDFESQNLGSVFFFDASGSLVGDRIDFIGKNVAIVDVPNSANYMCVNIPPNPIDLNEFSSVAIMEYLPRNEITEALYN